MTRPPRHQSERERDLRLEAELYLKGTSQHDISDKLSLSPATVSRDIGALQREWQEARLYDMNEAKNKELARIDNLEREYWRGWERSKTNAEANNEAISGPGGQTVMLHSSRGQTGDPRFLQGIMDCIERRCAILGLNAPKNIDVTTGGKRMTWAQFVNARVVVLNEPPEQLPAGQEIVDAVGPDARADQ